MKENIKRMIEYAEQNDDYELADIIKEIIFKFAITINCPSNWRDIGEELAEEYSDNEWIMDNCNLYDFKEYDI